MIENLPALDASQLTVIVISIIAVALLGRFLSVIKTLVGNAVGGLVILLGAQTLGISVAVTPLTLVVAAIAGLPGGLLLVVLSVMGVQVDFTQLFESVRNLLLIV